MFWESTIEGTKILFTHWEIWVILFVYGLILFSYYTFVNEKIMSRLYKGSPLKLLGALELYMTIGSLFSGILATLMVILIIPILLGFDYITPFSFFVNHWIKIISVGLLSSGITSLISIIPIIGRYISETFGVNLFIQGILVFRLLFSHFSFEVSGKTLINLNMFPGFLISVGFIIFSIVLVFLLSLCLTSLRILVKLFNALIKVKSIEEITIKYYDSFINSTMNVVVTGILSLSMYISYYRLLIHKT